MKEGFYSRKQLESFGFSELGENVLISKKASIYGAKYMKIGNNIRIDDFCLLVGNLTIENYVHIAAYTGLHASYGSITLENHVHLSSQVTIYAVSDDYSGKYMGAPFAPPEWTHLIFSDIRLERFSTVGCGTVLLPNSYLPEGTAVGAMSLVNRRLSPWSIYLGNPCRMISKREKDMLELAEHFEQSEKKR